MGKLPSLILIAMLVFGCKEAKNDWDKPQLGEQTQPKDPMIISYGIYSGFAESYSSWEVKVTTDSVICKHQSAGVHTDSVKPIIKKRTLFKGEREKLLLLADLKLFNRLSSQIGSPGHDDGSVQWLKIRANYYTKTVYIEQDSTVESLNSLVKELDKLRCD